MNPRKETSEERAKPAFSWQAAASVAIVIAAGLLTVICAVAVHRFEERQVRNRIERRVDNVLSLFSERLSPVGRSTAALQILFENSDDVSHDEFLTAAETLLIQNPEIGIFEWVPRVVAQDREAFLAKAREEVSPDFDIVDVGPDGSRIPAPVRQESWPITFIHPLPGNQVARGFDLTAGPTVATLTAARDSNRLLMGPPRRLVQDPRGDAALFFIQPVSHIDRWGEREFIGFVQAITNARTALEPVIELAAENSLIFDVSDITDGEAEPFLSTVDEDPSAESKRFTEVRTIERLGRQLRFRAMPDRALLDAWTTYYSQATVFGGLLATALLALYLHSLLRRTATITDLVDRRTEQLTESNRQLVLEAEQRRQAEAAALRAQQEYKFLVDSVDCVVWQVDVGLDKVVFVNRRAEDVLGYPVATWLGEVDFWETHVHPDDRERALRTFHEGVARGGAFEHSYRMIAADGRIVWFYDHVRVSETPGQPRLAHSLSFDITKQRDAEELLKRDAHLLSNVDDALVVTDMAGNITFWNHGAETIYHRAEADVMGKPFAELFPPNVAAAIRRNFEKVAEGGEWIGEWTDRRADGSRSILDSRASLYHDSEGKPAGIFTITRDITERKTRERESAALEAKLQHTQKLESLGVLAGGIAHDFNNLLTGILGYSSLLAMELHEGHPMSSSIAAIEQSALRAAALCQQMLAYAGRGKFVVEHVEIGEIVRDTSKLLESSISKGTQLEFKLQPGIPTVRADSTQLRQVVMNLVINASEALGEKGGSVVVSTGVVHANRQMLEGALVGEDLAEGDYVFLEVSDTGCGIKPENLRRIFEPFFSTKFTGRGLGLAAVLGIVRGHDGVLSVSSTVGEGTTFRVLLPPCAEPATRRNNNSAAVEAANGTVLVIDDETFVREAAETVLKRSGCRIESASGGQDGILKFEANPDGFDVVLLDLTMPGVHGVEVLKHIRSLRPKQPVVVMSGFTAEEAAHRLGGEMPDLFLEKPFRAGTLLETVARFVKSGREG